MHTQIRELDDGGQWDEAVALATGTGPDSSNTTFNAFDASLGRAPSTRPAETHPPGCPASSPGWSSARSSALLAGLAAALLGRRGVAPRLKEYR